MKVEHVLDFDELKRNEKCVLRIRFKEIDQKCHRLGFCVSHFLSILPDFDSREKLAEKKSKKFGKIYVLVNFIIPYIKFCKIA
jgi:hypothetical protein